MGELTPLLLGRPSVRDLAEDETASLADGLRAYLAYTGGGIGSIADVLLKRAAKELGIDYDSWVRESPYPNQGHYWVPGGDRDKP